MESCEPVNETDRLIGRALRSRRTALGLTLMFVADAAAITTKELAAIEGGKCTVYMSTLVQVCRVLGVSAVDLMSRIAGHARTPVV